MAFIGKLLLTVSFSNIVVFKIIHVIILLLFGKNLRLLTLNRQYGFLEHLVFLYDPLVISSTMLEPRYNFFGI